MADPRFKNLELKVGIFIFTAIVMTIAMVVGFLITQDVFSKKVQVVFEAKSGEGLSKSMPVMYSGFQLSRVHKIELRDDGIVELRSNIPVRYTKWVKPDSDAKIQAQGVIGSNAIVLSGGSDGQTKIANGHVYPLTREKAITDLLVKVEPMIDDVKSILSNVDNVTTSISEKRAKIEELLNGVGAVGNDLTNKEGSVGYLVRSDYLKNEVAKIIEKIKAIEDNVQKITMAVNSRVEEAKPAVENLDKGLVSIRATVDKIGGLTENVDKTLDTVQPTLKSVNKISSDVAETTTDLAVLREQTDEILNTTNRILLNMEEKWPFDNGSGKKVDEKVNLP